ncbi:MAG: FAD-dependent oxidoreductase [Pseudomonadota bacterium]
MSSRPVGRAAAPAVGRQLSTADGTTGPLAVVGAGIVGVCAAVQLKRLGYDVTLYDPGGPAAGTSFGNAGLISPDSCIPTAMPDVLRRLPGWLMSANAPIAVDFGHALKAAPWLYRFVRSGMEPQVRRIARAMRALHEPALGIYRDMLGTSVFQDLIRQTGTLQIWNDEAQNLVSPLVRSIWQDNGVKADVLSADEVRQLAPDLAPTVKGGLFFPNNGMTVSPARLVETLCEIFVADGGILRRERVAKIIPEGGYDFRVVSNRGDGHFSRVAVTSGIWSRELLKPLGMAPLLDAERGYHAMVADPGIELRLPILHKGFGIGATPMEQGLRLAGTVEFAGVSKPMDERRVKSLIGNAKALFPKLRAETFSMWMGFRPSMPDSLPVIDMADRHPGLFMAFGHGHFGMSGGPATGRALAAMVAGEPQEIDLKPYAANRF